MAKKEASSKDHKEIKNTNRPNGKAWKKSWKGQPPASVILEATAQHNIAKRKVIK